MTAYVERILDATTPTRLVGVAIDDTRLIRLDIDGNIVRLDRTGAALLIAAIAQRLAAS